MSQINVGFDNNSPQAVDRSYGTLQAGKTTPYASVAAANAAVISAYRFRGKTVLIDDGSGAKEFWWRVDTQDASLVPKNIDDTELNFVVGDSQPHTPVAGTTVFTHPSLVGVEVKDFEIEGAPVANFVRTGTVYYQLDNVAGTITLFNTVFSNSVWYRTKIKQL